MKNYEYKKIMDKMLDESRCINTGLYYTIADDGLDITCYTDIPIRVWDIEDIEAIIYNEELSKEDIEAATEAINRIGNDLEKMNLYEKMEETVNLATTMERCIYLDAMEEYGDGDNAIQYIFKNAEKWAMIYLWHEYIFKNAKKFLLEKKKCG